jgi:hypothetical protein
LTHALAIALVVVFLIFGRWQLHRAESGHSQSWAYAVEWPTFALMVIGFWVKIARDELRPKPGHEGRTLDSAGTRTTATAASGVRARTSAGAQDAAELAAYNRYLAQRAGGSGRDAR